MYRHQWVVHVPMALVWERHSRNILYKNNVLRIIKAANIACYQLVTTESFVAQFISCLIQPISWNELLDSTCPSQ